MYAYSQKNILIYFPTCQNSPLVDFFDLSMDELDLSSQLGHQTPLDIHELR